METAGIRASSWVVGKALSPLAGGVLEAWAASTKLGCNIEALKMELLHAQAILNNAQGREIHNPALAQLLDSMRQLAYRADDALDELDYFRIQDDLDGTYHTADVHAAGCVQDLALNARHTARACVNKLKFPMCTRASRHGEQDDGHKQGCLSGLRSCGRRGIRSSLPSSDSQLGAQEIHDGCMTKAAHNVGKHFSCFSSLQAGSHLAQTDVVENPKVTGKSRLLQTPKLKFERVEMSKNILNITEQLKPVCAKVSNILRLELLNSTQAPTEDIAMKRPKTTPQIIEPKLYGRDNHKKTVIKEIDNGECCELTVLPIVGPGGIGKTTFTQYVYDEMKNNFEVPIWICVSLDFNANKLAADIVKKIPPVNNENKNCSDEDLIKQRLIGKRVLLVLDDVWKHPENEWKKLIALFRKHGAKGNMVIVTTRLPEVANTVKTTKYSLELESLCDEDIMSFFEECVFGDQKPWADHLELCDVGSKIVKKLKGSPLAAITVGRLLRNKLTLNHWRSVLESKQWESQTDVNDIMPALKLSYDYLPFHLQQCFSSCALFPEDYEFGSEELVHLWIGLDILHSHDKKIKRTEDVELCYLKGLENYGFFKMIKGEDERPCYVIHDLLHELAVKVSSYESLRICSSNVRYIQIPTSVRHLSIIIDSTDVKDRMSFEDYNSNLSALNKKLKVEHLRTLMLFGDYHGSFAKTFGELFREATALRAIFLSGASYNLEDILHNFSKLVHLRYLRIKSLDYWNLYLPSLLFRLYHLEVLDLQSVLASSTRDMSKLVKLHHFLVYEIMSHLHSDIFGVGKLKLLQKLNEFRVGKESEGFEPCQLGQLTEIGGRLGIYNLENVQTKEEADELKLMHKNHVRELILEWDAKRSNKDPVREENILENLVPHSNLQGLRIKGHGGSSCPAWLCTGLSVKCLISLCLDDISWKNLPPLGELWMVNERGEEYQGCSISTPSFHNLKRLKLINIPWLKRWVGNGACHLFSHLESLTVRDCFELIELPFSHPTCYQAQREEKMGWFPKLYKLVIVNCPKLASVPSIPWRTDAPCSARMTGVGSGINYLEYPSYMKFKEGLHIEGNGDVSRNMLNFSNLTDLKELCMHRTPPLPLDELQLLTSLKRVYINDSSIVLPSVQSAGHGIYRFPVEDLWIKKCDTSGEKLTMLLSFLPSLSLLKISSCVNITCLGVAEHVKTVSGEQQQTRGDEEIITAAAEAGLLLLPPNLQELRISECEKISLLAAGEGSGGGLQRLRSLRCLDVQLCPDFLSSYSSPSSFFPFPTCLQELTLGGLKHMETLQALSNLTSLTELSLIDLEGSTDEGLWPLLAHGRLTQLFLFTSDFFVSSDPSRPHDREVFSGSSNLVDLSMRHNTGFLAAPICSLFSSTLTKLDLSFNNEVERLTKEQEEALQLLTSLQDLQFEQGEKLQHLPAGLHKLTSLKELHIWAFASIKSIPSLPRSLEILEISSCKAIKSLPNSLPSSLEILKISSCEAIKSLPKDGLPISMRELDVCVHNSEELKRECRKLIGTIPIIRA